MNIGDIYLRVRSQTGSRLPVTPGTECHVEITEILWATVGRSSTVDHPEPRSLPHRTDIIVVRVILDPGDAITGIASRVGRVWRLTRGDFEQRFVLFDGRRRRPNETDAPIGDGPQIVEILDGNGSRLDGARPGTNSGLVAFLNVVANDHADTSDVLTVRWWGWEADTAVHEPDLTATWDDDGELVWCLVTDS